MTPGGTYYVTELHKLTVAEFREFTHGQRLWPLLYLLVRSRILKIPATSALATLAVSHGIVERSALSANALRALDQAAAPLLAQGFRPAGYALDTTLLDPAVEDSGGLYLLGPQGDIFAFAAFVRRESQDHLLGAVGAFLRTGQLTGARSSPSWHARSRRADFLPGRDLLTLVQHVRTRLASQNTLTVPDAPTLHALLDQEGELALNDLIRRGLMRPAQPDLLERLRQTIATRAEHAST